MKKKTTKKFSLRKILFHVVVEDSEKSEMDNWKEEVTVQEVQ